MKLPSKITSYGESVISKFSPVLSALQGNDMKAFTLYQTTTKYFANLEEFVDTLDCLFALQKIRYDAEHEVICYVE